MKLSKGFQNNTERPLVFTYQNVMFWEPESRRLMRVTKTGRLVSATLLGKAKRYLMNNSIKSSGNNEWICTPIKDYNSTTYKIKFIHNAWDCNCQGFHTYGTCCHIIAVKQFKFIGENNVS